MILATIGEAMYVAERAPAEASIPTRHPTVSRGGTGDSGGHPHPPTIFCQGQWGKRGV
jgi:hypothetical protein